ncbi:MAG TPA: hypothetical protein VL172_02010 [Kofleriaceae bacterium]|jgi:hypothetical protein|nr:hypothetical protein [Kofleriaceae bacterium]
MRCALSFSLALLVACSSGPRKPAPEVPHRERTAGDDMLGMLPAGASAVIEIDALRLRTNAAVGRFIAALAARADQPDDPELVRLVLGILRHSDAAVIAVYDAGKPGARTLVLLRGLAEAGQAGAARIDARIHALGPPELVDQVRAIAGGAAALTVGLDAEWMILRARAMPEAAPGAWLRVTARLDFDARVDLASRFDLDAVPRQLSVWADVVDDLALVAWLDGDNPREGKQLGQAVLAAADRARRSAPGTRILLSPILQGLTVKAGGASARATIVVGPRALTALVDTLVPPPPPPPKEGS